MGWGFWPVSDSLLCTTNTACTKPHQAFRKAQVGARFLSFNPPTDLSSRKHQTTPGKAALLEIPLVCLCRQACLCKTLRCMHHWQVSPAPGEVRCNSVSAAPIAWQIAVSCFSLGKMLRGWGGKRDLNILSIHNYMYKARAV